MQASLGTGAPEDDEINCALLSLKGSGRDNISKVIIALGRISAQTLIASKIPISKLREGSTNIAVYCLCRHFILHIF